MATRHVCGCRLRYRIFLSEAESDRQASKGNLFLYRVPAWLDVLWLYSTEQRAEPGLGFVSGRVVVVCEGTGALRGLP